MDPPPLPTNSSHNPELAASLQAEILTRHGLPVSLSWLNQFLTTVKIPPPPLPALASTAQFRLISTDFTETLSKTRLVGQSQPSRFPSGIADVQLKSQVLTTSVPVQVLDIEDVGTSKWSQIEVIERVERGEEIRGREVIRTVPSMMETDEYTNEQPAGRTNQTSTSTSMPLAAASKASSGPHKLLLQDGWGAKVYAFELVKIPKIFFTNAVDVQDSALCIGAKLLLKKGTVVRRGLIMLRPDDVIVMGGRVAAWDAKWKETRKKRLMEDIQRNESVD